LANLDNQDLHTGDTDVQDENNATRPPDDEETTTGGLPASDPDKPDEDDGGAAVEQRTIVDEVAAWFLSLFQNKKDVSQQSPPSQGDARDAKTPIPIRPRRNKQVEREQTRQALAQIRAKESIEERLERYRDLIRDFEEDRENVLEKCGRWFFLFLAYVGPVIVALAFGKEIGDAYGGTFDLNNGWSLGMHVGSYFGELALAMMSLSCATALRRMQSDKGYILKLLACLFFLVLFSFASGLAQWFIALRIVDVKATGGYAALVFRVAMPPAVDIASLLYISIMKFKSLKSHIANLKLESDALRELNDAEIGIRKSQNNAKQQEAREKLLMDVEEIQAKAVLKAVEKSLNAQDDKRNGFNVRSM